MPKLVIEMDLESYTDSFDGTVSFAVVQADIDKALDSLYGNPLALTLPVNHHDEQVGTVTYTKEA